MRTVCFIVQSVYDLDPRVRRKAEALAAKGYAVDVLALRPADGKRAYALNGVSVRTMALAKRRGTLTRYLFEYVTFFLWAFFRVSLQMARRRYSLIDVNSLPDVLIFAPFLARWMGAKLVLDLHEITPEFYMTKYGKGKDSWMIRLLTYLEEISMNFADRVITINEPVQDLLVSRGLARSKCTVVMNVVDESRFAADSSAVPAEHEGQENFVFMYHGTLTSIYGLDIAIRAFALARQEMPGAELWVVGSGSEGEALARLAEEQGVATHVKLMGQVPARDIPRWLARCSAGVLPMQRAAFLEFAFPNKLPEFIVAGKPVIVARLRTICHYFSDKALQFFDPDSPVDLSRHMVRLYRDPDLRAALVLRAREEFVPIRWDVMRQRYLTLVASLIGPTQAAATKEAAAAETTAVVN